MRPNDKSKPQATSPSPKLQVQAPTRSVFPKMRPNDKAKPPNYKSKPQQGVYL